MKKKLVVLLATLCACLTALAQDFDKAKLDRYFEALATNNRFMGSVAVSKNGKLVYAKAVGLADVEHGTRAGTSSKYRIGSISKTFTAALVMKAVEEKKLKLDQTIDKWFPALLNAGKITVSNLLDHRSGIYNFTNSAAYLVWYTEPQTEAFLLEKIIAGQSDFEPDTKAGYSNANYVLLTFILEKVMNKPYPDLIATYITKPLGLKDTYVGAKIDPGKNEVRSYRYSEGGWSAEAETDMSVPLGAGAIVSTPTDLVKFADALFAGKIISSAGLEQMRTITDGHGMGLFLFPFDQQKGYGHTGGIDAFSSVFVHFPDKKLSFALTSNGGTYSNNDISIAVLSAMNGMPYTVPEFKSIALTEEELAPYLGLYSSSAIPLKITISKNKNVLMAQATGQSAFPLEAKGAHTFEFAQAGIVLEFKPETGQMTLKQGGGTFVFEKG